MTSNYDAGSLTIVPTFTLTRSSAAATTVDFTDSNGESFVAVQNGSKYYAYAATASAGAYLELNVSFTVYKTYISAGNAGNVVAGANDILQASGNYEFTISMTGRGKIGTTAALMYAATFDTTSDPAVVSSVTANATIDGNGTKTGAANSAIANVTYYVGIDGSLKTTDVEAGNEINSDGNGSSAITTVASLAWTSLTSGE